MHWKNWKRWSEEHPKPEYKVSKTEYDILRTVIDYSVEDDTFDDFCTLSGLLEKGYFKGATGETDVKEYFENCDVDYKLGGNKNVKRRKV